MSARKNSRARSRSARGPRGPVRRWGAALLFWLCLAVVVAAVAVAAREPLAAAFRRVRGEPAPVQQPRVTVTPLVESPAARAPTTPPQTAPASSPGTAPPPAAGAGAPSAGAGSAPPASDTASRPTTRKARLYFATVDDAGAITMKSVVRTIPASDSPLRDTLQALLNGPTAQELNLGLVSMVPAGAQLRGVVMRGDTAVVDFSEGFRFNAQGIEAMKTQLRQIVYAATEFPTVARVQILIDGKKVTWLGTEGVRIDAPLTRASFQK